MEAGEDSVTVTASTQLTYPAEVTAKPGPPNGIKLFGQVKGLTVTAPAEKIKHVLTTTTYHDAAETMAAEMAELPLFTDIPGHLVSAV